MTASTSTAAANAIEADKPDGGQPDTLTPTGTLESPTSYDALPKTDTLTIFTKQKLDRARLT